MAGHPNRDSNVKETEHVILQERAVGYNIWANMVYLLKEGWFNFCHLHSFFFSFLFLAMTFAFHILGKYSFLQVQEYLCRINGHATLVE
jgi:hypothetical protein